MVTLRPDYLREREGRAREERRKRENNMGEQSSFNNTLKGYKQIFELIKFSKMKWNFYQVRVFDYDVTCILLLLECWRWLCCKVKQNNGRLLRTRSIIICIFQNDSWSLVYFYFWPWPGSAGHSQAQCNYTLLKQKSLGDINLRLLSWGLGFWTLVSF